VFNPKYYYALPKKELLIAICVGAFIVFVVIYALIMQHARSARLDCAMQQTHASELARLWLDKERLDEQLREANSQWRKKELDKIKSESINKTLFGSTPLVRKFIAEYLKPFLEKFTEEEIQITQFLIDTLEKYGKVPSVASKYKNDYDIKQFKYCNGSKDIPITTDGKTSYWILAQCSLLTHTIRVAKLIIDEIKGKTKSFSVFIPKGVIAALAHDIGKITQIKEISVLDEVASKVDHPYLSAMILKERFPKYEFVDELATIVREHHIPVDKNAALWAQALKTADQLARRQEIQAWFVKTYGADAKAPNPFITLPPDSGGQSNRDRGANNDNKGQSANQQFQNGENALFDVVAGCESSIDENIVSVETETEAINEEQAAETIDRAKQTSDQTKRKQEKLNFGETKTPQVYERQSDDKGLGVLEFDLPAYDRVLLKNISELSVVINKKKDSLLEEIDISAIPYNDVLLVSFARLLYIFRSVLPEMQIEQNDYARMAHYAINEWRKRDIVLYVGGGYWTRKYEYQFRGTRRAIIAMIPFSIKALELNADDLLEQADQHPLYELISDLKMAKG
jgi:hypothetical protein